MLSIRSTRNRVTPGTVGARYRPAAGMLTTVAERLPDFAGHAGLAALHALHVLDRLDRLLNQPNACGPAGRIGNTTTLSLSSFW